MDIIYQIPITSEIKKMDHSMIVKLMSKRYSGKSFKDSGVMKKPKLTFKEKRKLKKEKSEQRKRK